jgi:hypothetical protein
MTEGETEGFDGGRFAIGQAVETKKRPPSRSSGAVG